MFKAIKSIVITTLVCLTAFQFDTTSVSALPSGISSKATAQSQLDALTVKTEGSMTGYSRDLFPHWSSQGSGCDTRQVVLKRDADSFLV